MLNRYYRRSRITEAKFRLLTQHFALDLCASDAARLARISHRSAITIFGKIRRRVAEECERQSPFKDGGVGAEDSSFGPRREHGRGAGHQAIVFGLLKRDGKVYSEIIPDCQKSAIQAVIRGRVPPAALINAGCWRGYDGLVDVGRSKYYRVSYGGDGFADVQSHINGTDKFWGFAKRRLQKFNGVPAATFYLHLKECEWRFNRGSADLYLELLRLLRQDPL